MARVMGRSGPKAVRDTPPSTPRAKIALTDGSAQCPAVSGKGAAPSASPVIVTWADWVRERRTKAAPPMLSTLPMTKLVLPEAVRTATRQFRAPLKSPSAGSSAVRAAAPRSFISRPPQVSFTWKTEADSLCTKSVSSSPEAWAARA
jgi:hypothetical protein